ncbi:MAG: NUDIX hydrolase [Caldilineaceae bacterium]
MAAGKIRAIAIAVIRRPKDGAILACYGDDTSDGRRFYRPLGGGIEFGETSATAVVRELLEETGAQVRPLRLLTVTENIFTHRGQRGHEVVFIWECQLLDEALFALDEVVINENGALAVAHWVHPDRLAAEGIHLYPDELPQLLRVMRK